MGGDRKPVRLFVRIEGHSEVCVGTARTIADVPALLHKLEMTLRDGTRADDLEPKQPPE